VLKRLAAALAVAVAAVMATAACESASPPPTAAAPAEPIVAASWVADDGSVVAVNLVVPVGVDPRRIRELAARQRAERPGARVIVRVFAATAGPERYLIGRVPTGDEPLAQGSPTRSLLGLYDFPP
jgi:hypothetical protein